MTDILCKTDNGRCHTQLVDVLLLDKPILTQTTGTRQEENG